MNNHFTSPFVFASKDEPENVNTPAGGTCAADVVLYGLNIIVPLMTAELLKVVASLFLAFRFDQFW